MKLLGAFVSSRRGFTLFEVSISLAIVTFGVVSVLMLFPAGIKAQQMSRFQILASARAVELIEMFSSATDSNVMMDREGVNPWDTVGSYRAYAPDLEAKIGNFRFGLIPLPMEIARRLDSDGDEIQKILGDGGYLYYSQPLATTGFNPVGERTNAKGPNESMRLLVAVTGYAQQNSVSMFPYKDWPYYTPYPSPPMHGKTNNQEEIRAKSPTAAEPDCRAFEFNAIQASIPGGGDRRFFDERRKMMLWEDTIEYDTSILDADKGDMSVLFNGIVSGAGLPNTNAWVEASIALAQADNAVLKALQQNKFLRSSGYWAYAERGWIPDHYYQGVEVNNKINGVSRGWAQINANGNKANNVANQVQQAMMPKDGMPGGAEVINPVANKTMKELSYESAIAYFALAQWYAQRKGVHTDIQTGVSLRYDEPSLLEINKLFIVGAPAGTKQVPFAVNAARFLAHAALCLTAHDAHVGGQSYTLDISNEYFPIQPTVKSLGSVTFSLPDINTIRKFHENALALVMRYAAAHPYDWGAPRPLNRAIMMDYPLIQYDPFGGYVPMDGTTFAPYNYGAAANQWKFVSAQTITNPGRSMSYPKKKLSADLPTAFGPSNHFTLTRVFQPRERCRQLVFWAVDWQAYEDFETAPSAPVDASRYPRAAPIAGKSSVAALINHGDWQDRFQFAMRNPEKTMLFSEETASRETGAEISILGPDNPGEDKLPELDQGNSNPERIKVFLGLYGADRNFNGTSFKTKPNPNGGDPLITGMLGKLDRGPVPKSVRMRAATVSRFNFYDPRLSLINR